MKTADEYAEGARHAIYEGSGKWLNDDVPRAMALFAAAQVEATLALAASIERLAAATLEAAEANYEAHKRRLLEALNEEAEDPSEEDLIRFEEALKDGTDNCPGGLVCEEYPSCSALMESPK